MKIVLWPVFTDVNIWLPKSEQSSDDDCVLRIFFLRSMTCHPNIQHTSICKEAYYKLTSLDCVVLDFFSCGLYSPTWIFDFLNLSRAVMMIVCSVFFLFLKVYIHHNSTIMTEVKINYPFNCDFPFTLSCGLYSPTWIFDFLNLSRAMMMIVCSIFFLFPIYFHKFK